MTGNFGRVILVSMGSLEGRDSHGRRRLAGGHCWQHGAMRRDATQHQMSLSPSDRETRDIVNVLKVQGYYRIIFFQSSHSYSFV